MFDSDKEIREYINKIQKDATICRCLFTAKYSTCFWCPSHPSSGVHKTLTAASGTGHITYPGNNLPPAWSNRGPNDGCDGHPKHVE